MRKILNIIFTVSIFSILTVTVYAAECTAPINDDQTSNDRTLTCDSKIQTTTRYKYPESGDVEVFNNGLCSIKCSEDLLLAIDPKRNVRAGMGFNYPLYVSGVRSCSATYDYQAFDNNLRKLVGERDSLTGDAKTTKENEIRNELDKLDSCESWGNYSSPVDKTKYQKYSMNPNVTLDVETSQKVDHITYTFKQSNYNSTYTEDTTTYSSCDLKDNEANACTENTNTVTGWSETARLDGKYTIPDRYIEKYTGEVKDTPTDTTCDAKDIYFTSFYEYTRPTADNPTDKGYALTLTANNLGNNIKSDPSNTWNLNVNCWYTVDNLIFPQGGTATGGTGSIDENYSKYGNTGFLYRIIDLSNPFPNRDPGENWYGKTDLITSTKNDIENKTVYEIRLNSSTISELKDYNANHKYDTFDLNTQEKSSLINDPSYGITRK